jgi:hypothetical protein
MFLVQIRIGIKQDYKTDSIKIILLPIMQTPPVTSMYFGGVCILAIADELCRNTFQFLTDYLVINFTYISFSQNPHIEKSTMIEFRG